MARIRPVEWRAFHPRNPSFHSGLSDPVLWGPGGSGKGLHEWAALGGEMLTALVAGMGSEVERRRSRCLLIVRTLQLESGN